jgi:hypothetical protein
VSAVLLVVAGASLGGTGGLAASSAAVTAPGGGGAMTCAAAQPVVGDRVVGLPVTDLIKPPAAGRWNSRNAAAVTRAPFGRLVPYQGDGDYTTVLEVRHPRNHGSGGSANPGERVVKWNVHFEAAPLGVFPCRSIVLAYDVMFLPGWTWGGGGKMHGLHIGDGVASGGRFSHDGASVRVMWQREGGAIAYVYAPLGAKQPPEWRAVAGSGKFGTGVFHRDFQRSLHVGRWNRVQLGVRLNTFGPTRSPRADGAIKLAVNGKTRELVGVVLSASPSMNIERILFSTFAGGPLAMARDGRQLFKGFALYWY